MGIPSNYLFLYTDSILWEQFLCKFEILNDREGKFSLMQEFTSLSVRTNVLHILINHTRIYHLNIYIKLNSEKTVPMPLAAPSQSSAD